MKACVMSSRIAKGTSKKTGKEFNSVIVHVVFCGDEKECEAVWIDPEMLNGYVPQYGDVIDITYNRNGYIASVNPVKEMNCELVIASNE